jgi:hypothetical protein
VTGVLITAKPLNSFTITHLKGGQVLQPVAAHVTKSAYTGMMIKARTRMHTQTENSYKFADALNKDNLFLLLHAKQ